MNAILFKTDIEFLSLSRALVREPDIVNRWKSGDIFEDIVAFGVNGEIDAAKADLLLYNLRYATIVDCRPTTHIDEILKVVKKTGIDEEKFLEQITS